jgi:hypothetical protein
VTKSWFLAEKKCPTHDFWRERNKRFRFHRVIVKHVWRVAAVVKTVAAFVFVRRKVTKAEEGFHLWTFLSISWFREVAFILSLKLLLYILVWTRLTFLELCKLFSKINRTSNGHSNGEFYSNPLFRKKKLFSKHRKKSFHATINQYDNSCHWFLQTRHIEFNKIWAQNILCKAAIAKGSMYLCTYVHYVRQRIGLRNKTS